MLWTCYGLVSDLSIMLRTCRLCHCSFCSTCTVISANTGGRVGVSQYPITQYWHCSKHACFLVAVDQSLLMCGWYMQGPVFMYYSLTNYYQNHRRYVKSRDDDQLRGADVRYSTLSGSDCPPFIGNGSMHKAYAPCGAIANSMFNGNAIKHLLLVAVVFCIL